MSTHNPTAEEAAKLLSDVSEEWQSFWCNHGVIARNMRELSSALVSMTDEQFEHHVNLDKNDFAAWVDEVLGDNYLATKLRLLTSLDATQRMVSKRIEELAATATAAAPTQTAAPEATATEEAPKAATKAKGRAAKKPGSAKGATTKPSAKKAVTIRTEKTAATASPAKKASVWSKLLKR